MTITLMRMYATRTRSYKTFFVLSSAEDEILNAHKYKNIKKFRFFLGSDKPRMFFSCSQMLTFFGILTCMGRENFMLS